LKREIILRTAQAWILLLIVGSLQPVRPRPVLVSVVSLHRLIHWLAFSGASLLLLYLCRTRAQEIRSVLSVFFLGLFLEYAQHLIYHNPIEWWDVRDDAFAILAALVIYRFTRACRRPSPADQFGNSSS